MLFSKWKFTGAILLGLISISNFALKSETVFPIAVRDQLSGADGVIIATFQGSSNTKNNEGEVTTVGNFFVEQVAGIPAKSILNRYSFRVQYPGGYWQGIKYKSKVSPRFSPGERVVLILKKGKFGYELPHHALSKFNFERKDGELFLFSKFYPDKKGVGNISWNEFNEIVEQQFGMRVGSYLNQRQRFVEKNSNPGMSNISKNRSPASFYNLDEEPQAYKIESYWLVLIFGVLGGLFSLMGKFQEEVEPSDDN